MYKSLRASINAPWFQISSGQIYQCLRVYNDPELTGSHEEKMVKTAIHEKVPLSIVQETFKIIGV